MDNYLSTAIREVNLLGDNIYIERFWRTIKYLHTHLFQAEDGLSLYME